MHERWDDLADTVFTHVALNEALPNSAIPTAFAEDGDGFLWIGSQNGLARWDGYRFRCYQPDPKIAGALPDNMIRTLHADARGRLWIGSNLGLARYDRDRDMFVIYAAGPEGLSHVRVPAVAEEGAALWVATEGGLDRLDPVTGEITSLRHDKAVPDRLPDDRIRALLRDRSGTLWVATPNALVRRIGSGPRFAVVALPAPGGRTPSPWSLFEDGDGRIWIGTMQDGAYVVERTGEPARRVCETGPSESLQVEGVRPIAEVRPGEIWLGTRHGLVAVNSATGRTRRLRHDPTLPSTLADNSIHALYRDRSGLVWVATDRALSRHDPRVTAIYSVFGRPDQPDRLSGPDVTSILPLPDGRVWLGLGSNGVDIVWIPATVESLACGLTPPDRRARCQTTMSLLSFACPTATSISAPNRVCTERMRPRGTSSAFACPIEIPAV